MRLPPESSRVVGLWFALSKTAVMPAAWDSDLPGFGPTMPMEFEEQPELRWAPDLRCWPETRDIAKVAVVADFASDLGPHRLVLPEVSLGWQLHRFSAGMMLSPQLVVAVEDSWRRRRRTAQGDVG